MKVKLKIQLRIRQFNKWAEVQCKSQLIYRGDYKLLQYPTWINPQHAASTWRHAVFTRLKYEVFLLNVDKDISGLRNACHSRRFGS